MGKTRANSSHSVCPDTRKLSAAEAILLSHNDTIITEQGPKEDSYWPLPRLENQHAWDNYTTPARHVNLTVSVFASNLLWIFTVFSFR